MHLSTGINEFFAKLMFKKYKRKKRGREGDADVKRNIFPARRLIGRARQ